MAFNLQTFRTRTLTAVLFAAFMLLGLLWNPWSFLLLFIVIHFGCWYELLKLAKKIYGEKYLVCCLFGLIYISLPVLMMIDLRFRGMSPATGWVLNDQGKLIPCGIIFSIWINDTMAYIVGSLIGRTPFSKISPKKTWEGTIGGAVLCVATMAVLGYTIPIARSIAVPHWIAIASICAIFGTAGDLLESKLKRMANVKDSGTFMPGHGGFLDRFDSMLLTIPFVWLYVNLIL